MKKGKPIKKSPSRKENKSLGKRFMKKAKPRKALLRRRKKKNEQKKMSLRYQTKLFIETGLAEAKEKFCIKFWAGRRKESYFKRADVALKEL